VWSKAGRFVEGLHAVGDILTKISVNCVINLHAALLFMCLILWVYPMHDYNCLYVYGYFVYMLHVYVTVISVCIHAFMKCVCMFTFYM
jgi:hypothetical protein